MIKKYITLSEEQTQQVKSLIGRCEEHDHATVPVQFDHSLNYFSEMHSWFLFFEDDQLAGVLSVFNPLANIAEISGCIHPAKRGAGKFNELMTSCKDELDLHNIPTILFVVDGDSRPGMAAIKKNGLECDHVEYLMEYETFKEEYTSAINIREAGLNDVDDFICINSALFHESEDESGNIILSSLGSKDRKQYMAVLGNTTVGICTLFYSENKATIYGLGIAENYQGKGYGYDLVNSVLGMLKDKGCQIELEVDSLNEKAYKLYKKSGFKEKRVVDYYVGYTNDT